jgi:biotin carboxyl carrier protein
MEMVYIAASGGRTHRVEVSAEGDGLRVRLDGREIPLDAFPVGPTAYSFLIGGRSYEVDLFEMDGAWMVTVDGQPFRVEVRRDHDTPARVRGKSIVTPAGNEIMTAPLPGKVTKILVVVGQSVQPGDGIIVLEAMKMENELKASCCGTVTEVRVEEGRSVNGGEVLVVIE